MSILFLKVASVAQLEKRKARTESLGMVLLIVILIFLPQDLCTYCFLCLEYLTFIIYLMINNPQGSA